jgi:hypothetical protein
LTPEPYPFPPPSDFLPEPTGDLQIEDPRLNSIAPDHSIDQPRLYDSAATYVPGYRLPTIIHPPSEYITNNSALPNTPERSIIVALPDLASPGSTPSNNSSQPLRNLCEDFLKIIPPSLGPKRAEQYQFLSSTLSSDGSVEFETSSVRSATGNLDWNHHYGPQYLPPPSQQVSTQYTPSLCSSGHPSTTSSYRRKKRKVCQVCGTTLADQDGLRYASSTIMLWLVLIITSRHMKTHGDNRKETYQEVCVTCGDRYKHPKDLKRHELKHRDGGSLQCRSCGTTIKGRKDNAKRHVMNKHGITADLALDYILPPQH